MFWDILSQSWKVCMHVRCPFGLHSLQRGDEKTLRQVFVGHQVRWLRGRLQSITIYILLFAGNAMVQVGFFQHWMVHLVYLKSISHRTAMNLWIYGAPWCPQAIPLFGWGRCEPQGLPRRQGDAWRLLILVKNRCPIKIRRFPKSWGYSPVILHFFLGFFMK